MLRRARCTEDIKHAGANKETTKTTFGQKWYPHSPPGSYFNLQSYFNMNICVRMVNIFFFHQCSKHWNKISLMVCLEEGWTASAFKCSTVINCANWSLHVDKGRVCGPSELRAAQHTVGGCVCLYVWLHVVFTCVWLNVCVNESMFVWSRPENSSLHMFRRLRLRRWAGPLGHASHSAISRASGWSSPPAPRTHTERRPESSHLILQHWEEEKWSGIFFFF